MQSVLLQLVPVASCPVHVVPCEESLHKINPDLYIYTQGEKELIISSFPVPVGH